MSNQKYSPEFMSHLSDGQLASVFHSNNWNNLDSESRYNACQELENRLAIEDGVNPRAICAEPMQGALYGYQQGNRIAVNSNILYDNVIRADIYQNDQLVYTHEEAVSACGWNIYDTIVHEHTHGVREDKGLCDDVYIEHKSDPAIYRIQNEEAQAFANGQLRTLEAISQAEAICGTDPERNFYIDSVKNDRYEDALTQAQLQFNDPFIDKTLEQFITDRNNNIYRDNPSPSYEKIQNTYREQMIRNLQSQLNVSPQIANQIVQSMELDYMDNAQHMAKETQMTNSPENIAQNTPENSETAAFSAENSLSDNETVAMNNEAENGIYLDDGASLSNSAVKTAYENESDFALSNEAVQTNEENPQYTSIDDGANISSVAYSDDYGLNSSAETYADTYINDGAVIDESAMDNSADFTNDGATMDNSFDSSFDSGASMDDGGMDGYE